MSQRLRVATDELHRAAETRPFITNVMTGRLTSAAHADLAEQYLAIYSELERAGEQLRYSAAGPLIDMGLDRTDALRRDLRALGTASVGISSATRDYVDHVRDHVVSSPGAWVGHAYARYLGDLAGGQAIAAVLGEQYGVPARTLNFYRFDAPPRQLREQFKAVLDSLALSAADQDRAIAEARLSFGFTVALFDQLAIRHRPRF